MIRIIFLFLFWFGLVWFGQQLLADTQDRLVKRIRELKELLEKIIDLNQQTESNLANKYRMEFEKQQKIEDQLRSELKEFFQKYSNDLKRSQIQNDYQSQIEALKSELARKDEQIETIRVEMESSKFESSRWEQKFFEPSKREEEEEEKEEMRAKLNDLAFMVRMLNENLIRSDELAAELSGLQVNVRSESEANADCWFDFEKLNESSSSRIDRVRFEELIVSKCQELNSNQLTINELKSKLELLEKIKLGNEKDLKDLDLKFQLFKQDLEVRNSILTITIFF